MSKFENTEAIELNLEELEKVVGGAFKPLPPKEGYFIYQIVKGDTLNKISHKFNCTVADILKWNPRITDQNKLYYGDYIYIKP